jgi:hypothetical protein
LGDRDTERRRVDYLLFFQSLRFGGAMIAQALKDDFYSLDEMAAILRLKTSTLKSRIYTGTEHPPYKKISTDYLFPKVEFREWVLLRPSIREVRRVS